MCCAWCDATASPTNASIGLQLQVAALDAIHPSMRAYRCPPAALGMKVALNVVALPRPGV